ncbi:MAG TPA: rod shape-determining protein MreC [Nitratifractor sp.]|nr:rod shape-determining protein MreC [Nitratifractor sp.]
MKKRSIFILLILVVLFIITTKYNGVVKGFFLDFINPIKTAYLNLTQMSDSYINQHKSVVTLNNENKKLKKLLLEQSNYIEQLSKVYRLLPSLEKKPYKNIYLVDTISYVKLNRLDEVLLTTPKELKNKKKQLYGLTQNDVVAGIVENISGKFYAFLLSHPKSTFGVTIGTKNIHGIAQGDGKKGMIIKFIPRWAKVNIGDTVKTSGLDNIFFPNIPVGIVTNVQTLDQYKQATIRVYANLSKPSTFFLISDPTPYLTTNYNPQTAYPGKIYPYIPINSKKSNEESGAKQTKDDIIEPTLLNEEDYKQVFDFGYLLDSSIKFNR